MAVRVAAVLALATGCHGANCEPAINGGTGQQRAEVDAGVSTFLDLLRPDLDLCIEEVAIVPRLEDTNGRIHYRTRTIELEPDLGALFHELCHGVQHQNDLSVQGYAPVPGSRMRELGLEDPNEIFAMMCSFGPRLSRFVEDTCPGDPAGLDLYRAGADLFVGIDEDYVDTETEREFVPLVEIPTDAEAFVVSSGSTGVVVELGERMLSLDPWTGAEVSPPADPQVTDFPRTSQGSAMRMQFDTVDGEVGYRWIQREREGMASFGCADPSHQMFAYDDWLWSARLDGGRFTLGVWLLQ